MAIVLGILGVLLKLATPGFQRAIVRSRESVLRQDLSALREAIDGYRTDQRRYPATLQDLVQKKYVRSLPVDPFTHRSDTWVTVPADEPGGGVYDVHSGTDLIGLDGVAYDTW